MAPPVASASLHQSTLRQLKWLVALLIISNIALGVFGFYLLRSMDRRYSELIGGSVPMLNDLQTLTARSVEAMRGTGTGLFEIPGNTDPVRRASLAQGSASPKTENERQKTEDGLPNRNAREQAIQHGRAALEKEKRLRVQLLGDYRLPEATKERTELQQAGDAFTALGTQVIDLFAGGKGDEAKRLRDDTLRPAFDRYLLAITRAADGLEAASLHASEDVSAKSNSMSTVILGVASWPVIIFGALLGFTAIFVLGLMILFRGREMNDMP